MAKKIVGALLLIAAVAIYLTVREEGSENAFGGVLAPVDSVRGDGVPGATPTSASATGSTTGNAAPAAPSSNYGKMVDRVHTRVNDAMDRSVERARGH